MGWRYVATRLDGAGGETLLTPELPLSDVRILDPLSAAPVITGKLQPEILNVRGSDGRPIIRPWSTAIYAEADGVIRAGGIVTHPFDISDEVVSVTVTGFLAYPDGQGWLDAPSIHYDADPAVLYRLAWARLQSHPGANLGLRFGELTTPVRVGQRGSGEPNTPGSTADEPFVFAMYNTTDLGKTLDDLLVAGSIEVTEYHTWSDVPGRLIDHYVEMSYPRRGRRLDARFIIGENVTAVPQVTPDAAGYASAVIVIGAGEGPAALMQAYARDPGDRLYRAVALSRRDITGVPLLNQVTDRELRYRRAVEDDIDTLTLRDTPALPVAAIRPGDEILLTGDAGWAGQLSVSLRITSVEYTPGGSAHATLRVQPSTKAYT